MRKYFNKKVTDFKGSFDEWYELASNYKIKDFINFEIHHIILVEVFNKNPELQRLFKKFDFDADKFSSIENGIPLQKKSLAKEIPGHSSHPEYDKFINKEINKILENTKLDDLGKFEEIQELIKQTQNKLEADVLLGNKNVNDITNW